MLLYKLFEFFVTWQQSCIIEWFFPTKECLITRFRPAVISDYWDFAHNWKKTGRSVPLPVYLIHISIEVYYDTQLYLRHESVKINNAIVNLPYNFIAWLRNAKYIVNFLRFSRTSIIPTNWDHLKFG